MPELLQWLPALLALVGGVAVVVTIREGNRSVTKSLDDHRTESRDAAKTTAAKIDTISADLASVRTDVAVLKARDAWETDTRRGIQAVRK